MKKRSKLLVVGILVVFLAVFSVSTASAVIMSGATLNLVKATADGNYTLKATKGTWIQWVNIISTDANANSLLAVALTALSTGNTVNIDYTGGVVNSIAISE